MDNSGHLGSVGPVVADASYLDGASLDIHILDLAFARAAGPLDWAVFGGVTLFQVEADLLQQAASYAKRIDIFLMAREQSVLSKLIALGGIRGGLDGFKALAMGADAVGFGSAAEIALGCRAC